MDKREETRDKEIEEVDKLMNDLEVDDAEHEQEPEGFRNQNEDYISEDFVDEVFLKDLEVELTENQLEERHKSAVSIKEEGNVLFRNESFTCAKEKYTTALRLCPLKFRNDRSIIYANRAACFEKLERRTMGIEDCTKAIELNSSYLKAYKRRALLYEKDDKLDEALDDYKKVFEMDKTDTQAVNALQTLPGKINEKNEKLKEQMMGTLKELGNKILRPFGLSTDNFELKQDPNSGGYSVNFNQNKK